MPENDDLKRQIEEARRSNQAANNPNSNSPVVTGAPIEGATREGDARKDPLRAHVDNDLPSSERVNRPDNSLPDRPEVGPLSGGRLMSEEEKRNLADQAAREGKENLTTTGGGKLTDSGKTTAKAILGENVVEDKNAEAIKADLSSTIAHPGQPPAQSTDPSRTIQRNDGTITTADRPGETAHYIHGARMMVTGEQKAKVDAFTDELNNLQDGRGIGDIPIGDIYWEKKKELDAYVARLKR